MYQSTIKNESDVRDNMNNNIFLKILQTKNFGIVFATSLTAYVTLWIADAYMSYLPGSKQEIARLEKEKRREKSRMLGWNEGLWTYWFPAAIKLDKNAEAMKVESKEKQ